MFFQKAFKVEANSQADFALLIDLDPKWQHENGSFKLTIEYKVYDAALNILKSGKRYSKSSVNDAWNGTGFYNAALKASQLVLADVLNELKPTSQIYTQKADTSDIDKSLLVDLEKPVSFGTGFFVNPAGEILTAAHVSNECLLTKARVDGELVDIKQKAKSNLLDLAVFATHKKNRHALPIRNESQLYLGEMITNISFPLQSILAGSPNLTRGNVSSKNALKGSKGQFQFSAPIQPGSSGGPVISDGGELLGVTVSTLNAASLIEKGILTQNINFALKAQYASKFMDQHNIAYQKVKPSENANFRTSNETALSAVVQLSCYQ